LVVMLAVNVAAGETVADAAPGAAHVAMGERSSALNALTTMNMRDGMGTYPFPAERPTHW
jgi:hypothetical protein